MGLFDNEALYFVESGRRARKLAADVSDPAGGVLAVSNTDRGDGAWTLDMCGDPDKAWIGRALELTSPTREVRDGELSLAFPYLVDGGCGRAVVLVEDIMDVPRMLRVAGASMKTVLASALATLADAKATVDNYRVAIERHDAEIRDAKAG
jgi:hypothetical protein